MWKGIFDLKIYQMVLAPKLTFAPTPLTVHLSKHLNCFDMASHTLGQFSIHLVS
jgi:hypothetical protein